MTNAIFRDLLSKLEKELDKLGKSVIIEEMFETSPEGSESSPSEAIPSQITIWIE